MGRAISETDRSRAIGRIWSSDQIKPRSTQRAQNVRALRATPGAPERARAEPPCRRILLDPPVSPLRPLLPFQCFVPEKFFLPRRAPAVAADAACRRHDAMTRD